MSQHPEGRPAKAAIALCEAMPIITIITAHHGDIIPFSQYCLDVCRLLML